MTAHINMNLLWENTHNIWRKVVYVRKNTELRIHYINYYFTCKHKLYVNLRVLKKTTRLTFWTNVWFMKVCISNNRYPETLSLRHDERKSQWVTTSYRLYWKARYKKHYIIFTLRSVSWNEGRSCNKVIKGQILFLYVHRGAHIIEKLNSFR